MDWLEWTAMLILGPAAGYIAGRWLRHRSRRRPVEDAPADHGWFV